MRPGEAISAGPRIPGAGVQLLAQPEIIAPPQYSIAWAILATLCAVVIAVLVVATLRITRGIELRAARRRAPDEASTVKAEFLRTINDIGARHEAGDLEARDAHHELAALMRRFVRRTTGYDVTSQDVVTLRADERTEAVGTLIADLEEPGFARSSDRDLDASLRRAREVVRSWS
ncbi:MAG: hypothetical protein Q4G40_03220 [Brachybacterium sp.]|nr:hypothetical protein [Brachybacterium sp.]